MSGPNGDIVYMRLYWPMQAALDGKWTAPKAEIVK